MQCNVLRKSTRSSPYIMVITHSSSDDSALCEVYMAMVCDQLWASTTWAASVSWYHSNEMQYLPRDIW